MSFFASLPQKKKFPWLNFEQDPLNARFDHCALPYISAISSFIAGCVLLWSLLGLILGKGSLGPRWLEPFVEEPKEDFEGLDFKPIRGLGKAAHALLGLSIMGLGLQLLTAFYPTFRPLMIYPAVSWGIAGVVLVLRRPKTAPKGLLLLYVGIVATQLIVVIDRPVRPSRHDIPGFLAILTAFIAIIIILSMPLRDPSLPTDEISPAFDSPTYDLRSPEDNLTLWRFMSVSWMAPLIGLGNNRQLNEEDVWDLGYEFKHKILHDSFRDLKGSVLSRLLQANGMDLIILTVLSLIELTASTFSTLLESWH